MHKDKTSSYTAVSFRFPTELVENLNAYSEITMIPKTRIVEKAISEYLSTNFNDKQ